jgi:flagellin-like hook-associated protein FlgL
MDDDTYLNSSTTDFDYSQLLDDSQASQPFSTSTNGVAISTSFFDTADSQSLASDDEDDKKSFSQSNTIDSFAPMRNMTDPKASGGTTSTKINFEEVFDSEAFVDDLNGQTGDYLNKELPHYACRSIKITLIH